MDSISHEKSSRAGRGASRLVPIGTPSSPSGVHNSLRFIAVALTGAALAACSQTAGVNNRPDSYAVSQQAMPQTHRQASVVYRRHVVARRHTPFATHRSVASNRPAAAPHDGSHGVASFYTEGTHTANGEKFDTRELTAAHRTLPFGTRVRVTNVATGQSVTVRINDRGPFVPGRVVDVSYGAAESLGIVNRGIAKVKLDVVQ